MENEKILATVGGVNITDAEVDAFIESLPKEQKAYAAIPQFRQQCVEQLVSVQLYALMAEEEKLDETDRAFVKKYTFYNGLTNGRRPR